MHIFSSVLCALIWTILAVSESGNWPSTNSPCALRRYSKDSSVCICNSTYCDTLHFELPASSKILVFTSSKNNIPFQSHVLHSGKYLSEMPHENVVPEIKYQTLKGFGGALTDSASFNLMDLSEKARQNLINSYFGDGGIEYNIVRIPMGSCDYSKRYYTYLDTPGDFNLSSFSLAVEDTKMRIPLLKQLLGTSSKEVSLYASPWTVPLWMKTNHNVTGIGELMGSAGDKYHKTWAAYFSKFFDEYKAHGIKFWGVTMQNEPSNGLIVSADWQSTGWWPESQKDFIKTDLGPELKRSGYGDLKLMILDDQRVFLPEWPKRVLVDAKASQYISGIAVHWYFDWLIGPSVLNYTHNLFPDKFILATEACNYDTPDKSLGSWELGEKYSNDILDNLNNWAIGWVDWNMCLNLEGGPNWVHNFDNSPIIVNASADEFYKQPMFYHLGHFSKFIPEGSIRLHSTSSTIDIKHIAFQRPDEYFVAVVLNREDEDIPFKITIGSQNLNGVVPMRSIQSYLWLK